MTRIPEAHRDLRVVDEPSERSARWSPLLATIGGLLWIPYGVFEMLQPWGTDTVYREDRGYEVITDETLFVAYALPGSLALLLTALGLAGVVGLFGLPAGRIGRIGRILAYVAAALAVFSLAGVIALFDPVFTSGRIFGTLALGIATLLVSVEAHKKGVARHWTLALLLLGAIGIFLLPLWPLVYALEWLPEAAGAAIIALFGLGWIALGYRLRPAGY